MVHSMSSSMNHTCTRQQPVRKLAFSIGLRLQSMVQPKERSKNAA